MTENRTLEKSFAHFDGAVARNPRWSWSARSPNGETVVITLWEDEISDDGHTITADLYNHKDLDLWKDLPGNRARIEDLKWARENCDGEFRVVKLVAKDIAAFPRSIARRYPDPKLVMKLIRLNEETGEFRAEGKR